MAEVFVSLQISVKLQVTYLRLVIDGHLLTLTERNLNMEELFNWTSPVSIDTEYAKFAVGGVYYEQAQQDATSFGWPGSSPIALCAGHACHMYMKLTIITHESI